MEIQLNQSINYSKDSFLGRRFVVGDTHGGFKAFIDDMKMFPDRYK